MQLTQAMLAQGRRRAGAAFDRRAAAILIARYPLPPGRGEADMLAWITPRRQYLEARGILAGRHILDHLELMRRYGDGILDDPAYRAVMDRSFRSIEERCAWLRHNWLEAPDG